MARVKKGVNAHKRHKKILKQAKGFYGQKSKVFRAANPAVMKMCIRDSHNTFCRLHPRSKYLLLW